MPAKHWWPGLSKSIRSFSGRTTILFDDQLYCVRPHLHCNSTVLIRYKVAKFKDSSTAREKQFQRKKSATQLQEKCQLEADPALFCYGSKIVPA